VERYKNTIRGWAQRHKNEIERVVVIDKRKKTLNDKFKIDWMHDPLSLYNKETAEEEEAELAGVEEEFNRDLNADETYRIPSLAERFAGK
jgi:hypothetical protein